MITTMLARARRLARRLLALNGAPHPDYRQDHERIAELRAAGARIERRRRRLGPPPLDGVMFPRREDGPR